MKNKLTKLEILNAAYTWYLEMWHAEYKRQIEIVKEHGVKNEIVEARADRYWNNMVELAPQILKLEKKEREEQAKLEKQYSKA